MKVRLIHDAEGTIVSFVPPGTELAGPPDPEHMVSEVEGHDLDAADLHLAHLQANYRVDCSGASPRLAPQQMTGTPRSGAGRPLDRSSTFPPGPSPGGDGEHPSREGRADVA